MEIFLKYSLEGLPKKILITDGHPAYPATIEIISLKHQLCIFNIYYADTERNNRIFRTIHHQSDQFDKVD